MADSLTLDDVVKFFREWRALKQQKSIPGELWDAAAKLVGRYEPSMIVRTLRISYPQYREQLLTRSLTSLSSKIPKSEPIDTVTFVNVTPLLAEQQPIVLEFTRKDGASARCHFSHQTNLQDTLSWFLRDI